MECTEFISKNLNYNYKAQIKKNELVINMGKTPIDFRNLKKIISKLSRITTDNKVLNVKFKADDIDFSDKLLYILFECLIYSLIEDYGKKVSFDIKKKTLHITTAGIRDSLLLSLINGDMSNEAFVKKFNKFSINKEHYRRLVLHNKPLEYLSSIYTEIKSFFENACIDIERKYNTKIDESYLDRVAEVVSELANNAYEHAEADCLIDIDITSNWHSIEGKRVFAINLAVVNFSGFLLGDKLCKKIEAMDNDDFQDQLLKQYQIVRSAYEYHKNFFDDNYTPRDFFNIASFQNQISSRAGKVTGGTGLPQLLKMLMEQSELDFCYVLSGNEGIFFVLKNLEFRDGWIGFNSSHNFMLDIPDQNSLLHHELFVPGCAFNLNLILKMEEK